VRAQLDPARTHIPLDSLQANVFGQVIVGSTFAAVGPQCSAEQVNSRQFDLEADNHIVD
jgi:hypothetical protein